MLDPPHVEPHQAPVVDDQVGNEDRQRYEQRRREPCLVADPDKRRYEGEGVGQDMRKQRPPRDRVPAEAAPLVSRLPAGLYEEVAGEVGDEEDN